MTEAFLTVAVFMLASLAIGIAFILVIVMAVLGIAQAFERYGR